jgi:Tol biopolymer transport system component
MFNSEFIGAQAWLRCRQVITGRGIPVVAVVLLSLLPAARSSGQEREIALRLNTLRIEPLGDGGPGRDVIKMGHHDHIGSPSCSRDGEWIAFDAYKTVGRGGFSPPECWVVRRDGSDLHKVADRGASTPSWSADATRLLFMRENQDDPAKDHGIFVVNRDGTGERPIGDGRWPQWSPDGKQITFSMGGRRGGGARPMARVYVAREDGSERRVVCDGDCPSWSPDGNSIAACDADAARPAPEIRVVNLHTGSESIVGYGWYRANWAPDGKSVVCNGVAGPDEGMVRLWVDPSGRHPESLLPGPMGGESPCYGGKGDALVFVRVQPRDDD